MNTIYLIRHAAPATMDYTNHYPGPELGETGIAQSKWIAEFLSDKSICQVFHSDFPRVVQTMYPYLSSASRPEKITPVIQLRERESSTESHESLASRVQHWLNEHFRDFMKVPVAVFSHCGPLNMILENLDPQKKIFKYPFASPHGCLTPIAGIWEIRIKNNQYSGTLIQCPIPS